MNSNFKLLLGALIGAGAGWFVGSVINDIIDIKQNPYEEDYHDSDEYPQTEDETEKKELFQRTRTMPKKGARNYADAYQENPELAALIKKYNTNSGEEVPAKEEDGIDADMMIEDELAEPADDDMPLISIISLQEFVAAEGMETVTLNYYDDDVVTDQHDNPVDHPEDILGEEALVSFGEMSEDEDVVYVRNLNKKVLYEVVRVNKEYSVQKARRERKRAVTSRLKEERDGEEADQG